MGNRLELKSVRITAYYSPPVRFTAYGPFLELVEQDGFRPDIDDGFEGSIPLSDAYGEMICQQTAAVKFSADRTNGLLRLGGLHRQIISSGDFRPRE